MSILILIIAAGSAYDYNNLRTHRSNLQNALDSAVLAAASSPHENAADLKTAGNAAYFSNAQNPCDSTPNYNFANGEVTASASCEVKTAFMGIAGYSDMPVQSTATAEKRIEGSGSPMCVMALDPADNRTYLGSGGSGLDADGCSVHVNSSNPEAVTLSGGSIMESDENCIVGGVKQGQENMTPQPSDTCDPISDPFWSHPKPAVGTCDYNDFNEDTDMTLNPGVYCGGLRASNSTFTFNPGLYIIKDGIFESTGGATLNGDGVTFFLTGDEAGIVWGGGGTYNIKAMSSGVLAGFVVFLDPDADKEDKSSITGGGDTFYEGVFYFPLQTLLVSGGGSATTVSNFTAYVANIIEFTGGSTLDIKIDPDGTTIPIPDGLFKQGDVSARLVH